MSSTLTDAAKGAAMGATLGPIGAAAGGILGALTSVLPDIGTYLFGKSGGKVATSAMQAAIDITGSANPTAEQIFGLPPADAAKLRLQLAQIAAQQRQADQDDQLKTIQAYLDDTQSARTMEQAFVAGKSPMQWAPAILSVVAFIGLFGLIYIAMTVTLPKGSEELVYTLVGIVGAVVVQATNYWLGSSSDSRVKTHLLANLGRKVP